MAPRTHLISLCAAALLAQGCASSQPWERLLAQEDYSGAVEALQTALAADADNPAILVSLAEAYYHLDELDNATTHLEQARRLQPGDSEAILLLGLVLEKRGDMDGAIEAYRSYAQLSRLGRARKIIKARLDRLIRERIRQDTEKALAQEEMLDVAAIPDNTVAVAPFRNMGTNESLDPLQKGLAEMMITDLSKVPSLTVLERVRMQEMMKEIGLAQTGAVDVSTAPRLGKLLGANRIVNGTFTDLPEEQLRLDISVSESKTAGIEATEAAGPLAGLFRLQKELTFGIVDEMGIELTDEQRDAIEEIPTESMLAFIAYSRGLDLEDQGMPEAATEAFEEAATLDPAFAPAQEAIERVEVADIGAADIAVVEEVVFEEVFEAAEIEVAAATEAPAVEEVPAARDVIDRLATTGQFAGAGFIPTSDEGQAEVREPLEEQEEVTFEGEGIEVDIVVPLPGGAIDVTGTIEEE